MQTLHPSWEEYSPFHLKRAMVTIQVSFDSVSLHLAVLSNLETVEYRRYGCFEDACLRCISELSEDTWPSFWQPLFPISIGEDYKSFLRLESARAASTAQIGSFPWKEDTYFFNYVKGGEREESGGTLFIWFCPWRMPIHICLIDPQSHHIDKYQSLFKSYRIQSNVPLSWLNSFRSKRWNGFSIESTAKIPDRHCVLGQPVPNIWFTFSYFKFEKFLFRNYSMLLSSAMCSW